MNPTLKIFITVLTTWLFTEIIKIILEAKKHKKIQWRTLFKYGGMPSAHSCFVTSLVTAVFLSEGFSINLIIVASIWILVIRDLLVIRTSIDKNTLNIYKIKKSSKLKDFIQNNTIAHTKKEMLVGCLIGLIGSYLLWIII
jgi:uncharacterized protein